MNKIAAIALVLALVFGVCSGYVWIVEAESASGFEGTQSGFKLIVNYEDGSSETFEHAIFSLLPYTITDSSGKNIESIDIYLLAKLSTDGTVSSWSVSGTQQVELYKGSETAPKTSSTIDIQESGSGWNSGESKQVSFVSLHWSQIEAVVKQYGAGSWSLQVNAQLQINVVFSDGTSDIASASAPAVALAFTYSGAPIYSITGWTLTISNGVKALSFTSDFAASTGLPTYTFHVFLPCLTVFFVAIAILFWRDS